MGIDFWIVSAFCVLVTGISKSGFAGGLGVISVPLMSLFIAPQTAAAIMLPILCAIDLANIYKYRRDWIPKYILWLLPGALIGIGLGTATFKYFNEDLMRLMIGLFALYFVVSHFISRQQATQRQPGTLKILGFGALSGFGGFIAHAGGPPIKALLLSQNLEKSKLVGTNSLFFFLLNQMKLVPYFFLGQFTTDNLLSSLYLAVFVPIGVGIGFYLHHLVSQATFIRIAFLFLAISGCKLVYDGSVNLLMV